MLLFRWSWPFLLVLAGVVAPVLAASAADSPSTMWEPDIAAFEEADRNLAPPRGAVLFVGSSSIRLWNTLSNDFPDRVVLNRGFGGSQMHDLLAYADRIVLPYSPRLILVYEGDNDLANGKKPRVILREFKKFARKVHEALPESQLVFIAIKPSPARHQLQTRAAEANERIARYCAREDWLSYVDVFWPAIDARGQPRADLFVSDGLHLNDRGYRIWAEVIRRHLAGL